jgi:hypothetical protein
MKFTSKTWLAIAAGALLASPVAIASDHTDGTQASADPTSDITDLFAWMTDSTDLTMIMDVNKAATASSDFSNSTKYVFHTSAHGSVGSSAGTPLPGAPTIPALGGGIDPEVDVICTFDNATPTQNMTCWVTAGATVLDYIAPAPIDFVIGNSSADGLFTVYAGLASDPFFFNLTGFQTVAATVSADAASLVTAGAFDTAGCPHLDGPTVAALDGQLTHGADGGAPVDNFDGLNVLAIVAQLDLSLVLSQSNLSSQLTPPVTPAVPLDTLVSVWASTNH